MSKRVPNSHSSLNPISSIPSANWEFAEEARRIAARSMSPAERLEMLEEMVDFIFSAWDLNPQLQVSHVRPAL